MVINLAEEEEEVLMSGRGLAERWPAHFPCVQVSKAVIKHIISVHSTSVTAPSHKAHIYASRPPDH